MASYIPNGRRSDATAPFQDPADLRAQTQINARQSRSQLLGSPGGSIVPIEFDIPAILPNRKIYCSIVGFAGGFGVADPTGDALAPTITGKIQLTDNGRVAYEFPIFHGPSLINTEVGTSDENVRGFMPPTGVMPATVQDSIWPKLNQLAIGQDALIWSVYPVNQEVFLIPSNIQAVTVVGYPIRAACSANRARIEVSYTSIGALALNVAVMLIVVSSNSDF